MGRAAKAVAIPTTMPALKETYTALQRGTVDAIDFVYLHLRSLNWTKFLTGTTNMSLGSLISLIFSI